MAVPRSASVADRPASPHSLQPAKTSPKRAQSKQPSLRLQQKITTKNVILNPTITTQWILCITVTLVGNERMSRGCWLIIRNQHPHPLNAILLGAVHILRQPKSGVPGPPLPPPSVIVSIWLTPPPPLVSNGQHLAYALFVLKFSTWTFFAL